MAIDRDAIVKRAERLLQQGRLDGAIGEYAGLVEARPHDWTARNALGDLYARRGDVADAVTQYLAFAGHHEAEGFLPRAAAVYKKVLKIDPACETALERLADISARQNLLGDAKLHVRRWGLRWSAARGRVPPAGSTASPTRSSSAAGPTTRSRRASRRRRWPRRMQSCGRGPSRPAGPPASSIAPYRCWIWPGAETIPRCCSAWPSGSCARGGTVTGWRR